MLKSRHVEPCTEPPMDTTSYDALVIGCGQAGAPLATRLARSGLRTALVERGELGGTCVNTGCTPTKALVASARVAWLAGRAQAFGVRVPGPVEVDWPAVRDRARAIVQDSRDSLLRWIEGTERLELVRGAARLCAADAVQVGERRLRAPRIFLNVGASPVVPDWIAAAGVPFLTSDTLLGLQALPEHLVILGGGYIALEIAQVMRRFGAAVTVVERGERFLPREDADVADAVHALLAGEGVTVRTGLAATGLEQGAGGRGVALAVADAQGRAERLAGSHLLVAVGRRPNTAGLGLELAGLAPEADGHLAVDGQLRTRASGIWALGDVNGRGAFTHTSYNDYEIVAANLLDGDPRRVDERVPAFALYTDPPLARIGMNKTAARAAGRRVLVGRLPMSRVGRARERGETDGFMEALVDAGTQRLLGATIFGIEGDEAIHGLLDVMQAGLPCTAVARTMHVHPTVSELIPTMLQSLEPLA
jgi:pyruvate/2-oxoglutarate dehydrogenase complex dihydrolipoamide dehydrogenase (E3) component